MMAFQCKRLFTQIREMTKKQNLGASVNYEIEISLGPSGEKKITGSAEPHETEAFHNAMASAIASLGATVPAHPSIAVASRPAHSVPSLAAVIQDFLSAYPKEKAGMLKKHQTCLEGFRQIVGDMVVNDLKRMNVKAFFDVLQKLPPRWSDIQRREGLH